MSAVVVGWTGRCPDPKDRARLIAYLERLAEVSDSYLRNRLPERVIASSRKSDLREKRQQARANIEFVNGPIAGQVVISSGVVPDHNTFLAAARDAGLPTVDHPELDRGSITWLQGARLSGIDFRLYDPSQLHSGADRLSFVFLETKAAPFLDLSLIHI